MRDEMAEVKECVVSLVAQTSGTLAWEWDDYIGAMLATFPAGQAAEIDSVLDACFSSRWDHKSIFKAPADVLRIAAMIGGIRASQQLFVTRIEREAIAYAAWWPWGDGNTISIRIGLLLAGTIPDVDAAALQKEFVTCFTDETG